VTVFIVKHKGRKYWANKWYYVSGRVRWVFWSDHKGLFYHGHFTQDTDTNEQEAYTKFLEWLPFKTTKETIFVKTY
jgi:hypothetical protein